MLNSLDYSYNGEESIVHRLNPVVKIIGLVVYVFLCLLKFNNLLFIVSISFVFLLLLLSNIRMIKYLKTVWKLKYIIVVMYMMMLNKNMAFFDMNVIVFKVIFLFLYIKMLVFTTTKMDLGKGCAIVVDMFNLIGFSIKKITMFFVNLFVYPSVFIDSYIEFFTNLEIKGNDYTHTNLLDRYKLFFKNIKNLFKMSNDKMKARKSNMKYRFYKSNVKSQYKYRNKLCIFDYIFIIVNIGMLVFYILKVRV